MGTRKFKPTTPSRRFMSSSDFSEVTRGTPEKKLVVSLSKSGGRNNRGRMTVRHRGGGHKRRYRVIDFRRDKDGVPGTIATIEYDPNRSARIALVHYADGEKRYILAPNKLEVGATVVTSDTADIQPGNCMHLHAYPWAPGCTTSSCRSVGADKCAARLDPYAQVMAKEGEYVLLRLPSGELRKVHRRCLATVGQVGNLEHENQVVGKAGRTRWLGRRPKVRGTAMNPIDHPHGGGEGRAKGRHPVTPWGKPTKGYKTRSRKNASNKFIVKRRK